MFFYFKRALQDFSDNRFLHMITIITIALSILITSAAVLLFLNLNHMVNSWKSGVRIMTYLDNDTDEKALRELSLRLGKIEGISSVTFISKEEALEILRSQMKNRSSILENLERNPLPDAFEMRLKPEMQNRHDIEQLASRLKSMNHVNDVEYGKAWFHRITTIFNLVQFAGAAMAILFFMVTVFIVSNTIRLALYARREEIEIMQLVGATGRFIKSPSYIAGLIQGAAGGVTGISLLYLAFLVISSKLKHSFSSSAVNLRFLPMGVTFATILYSIFVGWLGCFLSINQFLKKR